MGGVPKALAPLAGKPLLQHVIDRVSPQVARLVLSVERPSDELAAFGLPQLGDPEQKREDEVGQEPAVLGPG